MSVLRLIMSFPSYLRSATVPLPLKCLTGKVLTTLNNHLKHFIIMNILQGILMNKFEI